MAADIAKSASVCKWEGTHGPARKLSLSAAAHRGDRPDRGGDRVAVAVARRRDRCDRLQGRADHRRAADPDRGDRMVDRHWWLAIAVLAGVVVALVAVPHKPGPVYEIASSNEY